MNLHSFVPQETARRTGEEREALLRDQINTALQKIRAYARDMEVRMRLCVMDVPAVGVWMRDTRRHAAWRCGSAS